LLPIESVRTFEFIINLKAAKQIGLTIPPNVLVRTVRGKWVEAEKKTTELLNSQEKLGQSLFPQRFASPFLDLHIQLP